MDSAQPGIDMAYSIGNVAQGHGTKQDAVNIGWGYVMAGLSAIPMGGGSGGRVIPWSSRSVRAAAEALEFGASEVGVASRSEAAELFLGRYHGAGYRNTTGWAPREVKDFFGSKAGTYHWDEGLNAFPHDASHLQIHTPEGPVIRIYFPD